MINFLVCVFPIFRENTMGFSIKIIYLPNKEVKKQNISMKEWFLVIEPLTKVCAIDRNTITFKYTQNIITF